MSSTPSSSIALPKTHRVAPAKMSHPSRRIIKTSKSDSELVVVPSSSSSLFPATSPTSSSKTNIEKHTLSLSPPPPTSSTTTSSSSGAAPPTSDSQFSDVSMARYILLAQKRARTRPKKSVRKAKAEQSCEEYLSDVDQPCISTCCTGKHDCIAP